MSPNLGYEAWVNSVEGLTKQLQTSQVLVRELRETNKRLEEYGQKGIESYKSQIEYLKNKVLTLEIQLEGDSYLEQIYRNSQ